jgi:hypothetical protein
MSYDSKEPNCQPFDRHLIIFSTYNVPEFIIKALEPKGLWGEKTIFGYWDQTCEVFEHWITNLLKQEREGILKQKDKQNL